GLGLAGSLARRAGGTLALRDAGPGTEAELRIPVAHGAAAPSESSPERGSAALELAFSAARRSERPGQVDRDVPQGPSDEAGG
uniref:hypothetical protein n=1 Tax=Falsiroseomonas oryziterrae TaxID=2911368 RepID=UPI001F24425E